ncbi:hypothetical protein RM844_21225 [Streptomyces sp. DSM 44915]|uniref:Uncharacterized protein n=1 Tax=Streptomyces chisholmiae TaxID=3075540 RepID=A0ABU2JVM7_9ACTN|nr:hypothetical protein [Streptomyces sp. DSM 44915]MDT0268813.1 hypothetical protein [Streptomyces sp. DSM 44915]
MPTVQPPRQAAGQAAARAARRGSTGSGPTGVVPVAPFSTGGLAEPPDEPELVGVEGPRVVCPECARSIALGAADEPLPQHALCATPWQPFGLTICPGSGREPAEAGWSVQLAPPTGGEVLSLATLPEGLDWRLQPFSHAAGPAPALRQAA